MGGYCLSQWHLGPPVRGGVHRHAVMGNGTLLMPEQKRAPKEFKVVERDSYYYVVGLQTWDGREKDTMLLYHYPEGDVDSPYDHKKMLTALYDTYQTNEELVEGDTFDTPHGRFKCVSFHVVPD